MSLSPELATEMKALRARLAALAEKAPTDATPPYQLCTWQLEMAYVTLDMMAMCARVVAEERLRQ